MKLGVVVPVELGRAGEPECILEFARAAESLGFDEISAVEHASEEATAAKHADDERMETRARRRDIYRLPR